jgi:hypothetical protein
MDDREGLELLLVACDKDRNGSNISNTKSRNMK